MQLMNMLLDATSAAHGVIVVDRDWKINKEDEECHHCCIQLLCWFVFVLSFLPRSTLSVWTEFVNPQQVSQQYLWPWGCSSGTFSVISDLHISQSLMCQVYVQNFYPCNPPLPPWYLWTISNMLRGQNSARIPIDSSPPTSRKLSLSEWISHYFNQIGDAAP